MADVSESANSLEMSCRRLARVGLIEGLIGCSNGDAVAGSVGCWSEAEAGVLSDCSGPAAGVEESAVVEESASCGVCTAAETGN